MHRRIPPPGGGPESRATVGEIGLEKDLKILRFLPQCFNQALLRGLFWGLGARNRSKSGDFDEIGTFGPFFPALSVVPGNGPKTAFFSSGGEMAKNGHFSCQISPRLFALFLGP